MSDKVDFGARFRQASGKSLERNVLLKEHSSFRIGGKADFFYEPATPDELRAVVEFARGQAFPFYVIGGGNNILFADEGYRGLLIRNRALGIASSPDPDSLEILSGTPLSRLLQAAVDNSLEGFDFLAGIPGTLGGALYSNAGAFGHAIGDILRQILLLDGRGNIQKMTKEEMAFDYRRSALQKKHDIVLSAVLQGTSGDSKAINAKIKDNLDKRQKRQPAWGTPCAGSYFKNPVLADRTKIAAGRILEEAGARGMRVGDAAVFPGHCNFLINLGKARARDVLALAGELKEKVSAQFGIVLEEEVIYLPESFSML